MIRCQSFAAADAFQTALADVPVDFSIVQLNAAANAICLDSKLLDTPWQSSHDGMESFGQVLMREVRRSVQDDPLTRPRTCSKVTKEEWAALLKDDGGTFTLWRRIMFGDLSQCCKRFGCNASLRVYAVAYDVKFKVFSDQMNERYPREPCVIEPSHEFRIFAPDGRFGPTREVELVNTLDKKWTSTRRMSTNIPSGVAHFLDQLGRRVSEQVRTTSKGRRLRVDKYAPCWSLSADQPKSLWVGDTSLQMPPVGAKPPAYLLNKFLAELSKQSEDGIEDEVVDLVFHGTTSREAMLNIATNHLSVHYRGDNGQKFGPGNYYSTEVWYSHDYSANPNQDGRSYIVVFLFLRDCDTKRRSADGVQPPSYFRVSEKESVALPVAYIELMPFDQWT